MPDAELADEIAYARIYANSKDQKIKRKFAARLAECWASPGSGNGCATVCLGDLTHRREGVRCELRHSRQP